MKGSKKVLAAETVGSVESGLQMMKNIKTTELKSAWMSKSQTKKYEGKKKDDIPSDCEDIIDVLSLIPPEILNSRNVSDVLQDSFDEDTKNEIALHSDLNVSHDEVVETANPQILLAGQEDDDSVQPENIVDGQYDVNTAQPENIVDGENGVQSVQPENIVDGQDHVNRVHPENIVDRQNGGQGIQPQNNVDGQDSAQKEHPENIADGHTAVMIDGKSILDEIVFRLLQQENNTKWKKMNLTAKKLFEDVLSNADNIQKHLTVNRVEIISDVYTLYTKANMKCKKSDKKAIKVNEMGKIFGDKNIVAPAARWKSSPASLQNLVNKYIMEPEYPKNVLPAACAKSHYIENIDN